MLFIAAMLVSMIPDAEPLRFEVKAFRGPALFGVVEAVTADGKVSFSDLPFKDIPIFELQSLTVRPALPQGEQALLANGDRIAGTFLRGDDRTVTFRLDFGATQVECSIPLTALDVLWLNSPPAKTPTFADGYTWLTGERNSDIAWLTNGERFAGDFDGLSPLGELRFKVGDAVKSLPKAVVQAIAFNPSLSVRKPSTGIYYSIVTASGTRLTAKSLVADAAKVDIVTSFNTKLSLPWKDVAAITRWSDDVVPLASLKPNRADVVPFGALIWPWKVNRSVKNNPLSIKTTRGVEVFESGLGVHAKTTLEYKLDGKYQSFEATVGLDAATGRRGSAVIRVLVDGQEQVILNPLNASADAKPIRVKVAQAKTLTLITDFGPNGDVQADLNWVNARLLK